MTLRRLAAVLLLSAVTLGLCGCGSLFEKEYVATSDYVPSAPDPASNAGRIDVGDFDGLKDALLSLVTDGEKEGNIAFDAAYQGEIAGDMANACWQVRTQDALCAYCVENISYELSKIVSYYEARVSISYSEAVVDAQEVVRLPYTTGLNDLIREQLDAGRDRMAVLIDRSIFSAEDVDSLVSSTYRKTPSVAPREPEADVKMYSGNGMQRLYEIKLDYGADEEELSAFREELALLNPFEQMDVEEQGEAYRAYAASRWLAENVEYAEEAGVNGIYDALVGRRANSEGVSFAYVELCRWLGLESHVIYGQRSWHDYCWNIVSVDGNWYHVDNVCCMTENDLQGFLLRDEDIWDSYRWDVSAYPRCDGELRREDFFAPTEEKIP